MSLLQDPDVQGSLSGANELNCHQYYSYEMILWFLFSASWFLRTKLLIYLEEYISSKTVWAIWIIYCLITKCSGEMGELSLSGTMAVYNLASNLAHSHPTICEWEILLEHSHTGASVVSMYRAWHRLAAENFAHGSKSNKSKFFFEISIANILWVTLCLQFPFKARNRPRRWKRKFGKNIIRGTSGYIEGITKFSSPDFLKHDISECRI